jgi:lipopolysaccharide transport system permease protein
MRLFPLATEAFGRLYRNRALTFAMAKREITDKYTRQVLGSVWAIGHPLVLVCVYIFLFQVVLKLRMGGTVEMPLDYVAYLLSGLIPWLAVQESLGKGSTVITSQANLVKQVVFPIDVLPVKSVLACFVTQVVGTACLMAYVLVDHGGLPWTYALGPRGVRPRHQGVGAGLLRGRRVPGADRLPARDGAGRDPAAVEV